MSKLRDLIRRLKTVLQIDRPDLDFGIYRIMNARAGEINQFLEHDLPDMVRSELTRDQSDAVAKLTAELQEKEEQCRGLGMGTCLALCKQAWAPSFPFLLDSVRGLAIVCP